MIVSAANDVMAAPRAPKAGMAKKLLMKFTLPPAKKNQIVVAILFRGA